MQKSLGEIRDLKEVPDYVEDTGEVNWLVQEAVEKEIPIPVITHSLIELFRSRRKGSDAARAVAMNRHGFGGHPYGKDDYIAKERKTSARAFQEPVIQENLPSTQTPSLQKWPLT